MKLVAPYDNEQIGHWTWTMFTTFYPLLFYHFIIYYFSYIHFYLLHSPFLYHYCSIITLYVRYAFSPLSYYFHPRLLHIYLLYHVNSMYILFISIFIFIFISFLESHYVPNTLAYILTILGQWCILAPLSLRGTRGHSVLLIYIGSSPNSCIYDVQLWSLGGSLCVFFIYVLSDL